MDHWLSDLSRHRQHVDPATLERYNRRSEPYGLILSESALQRLLLLRTEALQQAGRVELGGGVLEKLIAAFCDSPYVVQSKYEDTLTELQELFYYFKNECRDLVTDDELLDAMRLIFNSVAHGSVEFLGDVDWETMYRVAITGSLRGTGLLPPEYE